MIWKGYLLLLALNHFHFHPWVGWARPWDVVDAFVALLSLVGLFAFAWRRKIGSQVLWQVLSPALVIYGTFYQFVMSPGPFMLAAQRGMSPVFWAGLNIVLLMPLFYALLAYAHSSPRIWKK